LTEKQFKYFQFAQRKIEENKVSLLLYHVANSGAIIGFTDTKLDMVRSSAISLGFSPSDRLSINDRFKPVFSLKTEVVFVKELPEGFGISYEHTFINKRNSIIATFPIGYGYGYPASFSNKGQVLIKGKYASIVGRICMDQMMIDVTDIPNVKVGEQVVLVGKQGNNTLTPEEVGGWAGMIHTEFTSGITSRVPRVYLKNGELVKAQSFLLDRS